MSFIMFLLSLFPIQLQVDCWGVGNSAYAAAYGVPVDFENWDVNKIIELADTVKTPEEFQILVTKECLKGNVKRQNSTHKVQKEKNYQRVVL